MQFERRRQEARDLEHAAGGLELHKRKGTPYNPVQDGFVFPKDQTEATSHQQPTTNNQ
jgi:hypothetical protein